MNLNFEICRADCSCYQYFRSPDKIGLFCDESGVSLDFSKKRKFCDC